ncbi:MAG: LLM class flavin-dependent oxidoreductase, partial [Xanthobacteraceae bacterium]
AAQDVYTEGLELILKGLTVKRLDFHGKHFSFDDVPMPLEPLQKPHPPLWYGVHAPDSAERAAKRNLNVVSLDPPGDTRLSIERYRATWRPPHPGATLPKLGLGRFIVVAETDAQALALARRAYPVWHQSFTYLFRLRDQPQNHARPPDFDALMARGQGVAGSPATVMDFLKRQLAETQCNYVVGQFAFGDMTREEALGSIGLFVSDVMPGVLAADAEALIAAR